MGNTCSSVHIALTGTTPDAIEGIVRAYTTLGFERAKTASPEGGKHVILLRKEGDAFLSVYDSDNAALDTGELKDRVRSASSKFAHNSRLPKASLQWAFPDRRSEIPQHPLGRRTPPFCFLGLVQCRMGGGKCS